MAQYFDIFFEKYPSNRQPHFSDEKYFGSCRLSSGYAVRHFSVKLPEVFASLHFTSSSASQAKRMPERPNSTYLS
jgi:hypothetical protein